MMIYDWWEKDNQFGGKGSAYVLKKDESHQQQSFISN